MVFVLKHGEHDDLRIRIQFLKQLDTFYAILTRQPDIRQDLIHLYGSSVQRQKFLNRFAGRHDLTPALCVEKRGKTAANRRNILNDGNPDHLIFMCSCCLNQEAALRVKKGIS